jgi:hypothetical protein
MLAEESAVLNEEQHPAREVIGGLRVDDAVARRAPTECEESCSENEQKKT